MNQPPILPRSESEPALPEFDAPATPRWRAISGLALLLLYILAPAVAGATRDVGDAAILPPSVRGVLILCIWELGLFGVLFGMAIWLARLRPGELRWRWRGGWWVVPRGLGWSLALRLGVGIVLVAGILGWRLATGTPVNDLQSLRPKIESIVDVDALRQPAYMVLMLTLVSFGVAGLREELWRSAMLVLLAKAIPQWFGRRWGAWIALAPVALAFGLAHTPQGAVGVGATAVLGLGLGAIMLFHDSIWEAVMAHGFFNAATFAVLPYLADQFGRLIGK